VRARLLALLATLVLLALPNPPLALAQDDEVSALAYDAEIWLRIQEPTEAYMNTAPGYWQSTDEVHWEAHPTEWYVVLLVVFDEWQGDWAAAVREDDPEEIVVWLALDYRVELIYADYTHPPCSMNLANSRCVGRRLSTVLD
jgi:hypothetical protein